MLREMAGLGFERVELSHGVRISLLPGVLKALEEGVAKVATVHNFCPLPAGVMQASPNLYSPAARDKRERFLWARHTQSTVNCAAQTGARVVVLHAGFVSFLLGNPGAFLNEKPEDKALSDLREEDAYNRRIEIVLNKVRKKAKKHMPLLKESLREILPAAREKGVRLGIENREGLTELPVDEDLARLFEDMGEPETLGYWHDAGHAQLKEQAGVIEHQQILMENRSRLLGFHLHDVSPGGKDHRPAGSGVTDWAMLRQFIRPEHLLVIEPDPKWTAEEVVSSREFIGKLLASGSGGG